MMSSLSELDRMILDGQGRSNHFAETLVNQYYEYVYRLAFSILSDLAEADDVCQDAFIAALLHIDRYTPGTNLKAWLSKIAVNKCRAVLRKRKSRRSMERAIQYIQRIFHNSPSTSVLQAERKNDIWSAVNLLSEKHRVPVILYYVYDLKIREIADILNIPAGTVSSRLHYAVKKLGNYLQDIGEN